MKPEDALRKIELLRRMKTENGAMAAEADNAERLAEALTKRYAIKGERVLAEQKPRAAQDSPPQPAWMKWQELLNEFGLRFSLFGQRGTGMMGDKVVHIKLDTREWWIERRSKGGTRIVVRDRGLGSLRKYLNAHARSYSLFGH